MPRALSGAGLPLRPEDVPDWVFHIGYRPGWTAEPCRAERVAEVRAWIEANAAHLIHPPDHRWAGRYTRDFRAEGLRRRWQELDGYGTAPDTVIFRPGDDRRLPPRCTCPPAADPRRLLCSTDETTGPISGSENPRPRGARRT